MAPTILALGDQHLGLGAESLKSGNYDDGTCVEAQDQSVCYSRARVTKAALILAEAAVSNDS